MQVDYIHVLEVTKDNLCVVVGLTDIAKDFRELYRGEVPTLYYVWHNVQHGRLLSVCPAVSALSVWRITCSTTVDADPRTAYHWKPRAAIQVVCPANSRESHHLRGGQREGNHKCCDSSNAKCHYCGCSTRETAHNRHSLVTVVALLWHTQQPLSLEVIYPAPLKILCNLT